MGIKKPCHSPELAIIPSDLQGKEHRRYGGLRQGMHDAPLSDRAFRAAYLLE